MYVHAIVSFFLPDVPISAITQVQDVPDWFQEYLDNKYGPEESADLERKWDTRTSTKLTSAQFVKNLLPRKAAGLTQRLRDSLFSSAVRFSGIYPGVAVVDAELRAALGTRGGEQEVETGEPVEQPGKSIRKRPRSHSRDASTAPSGAEGDRSASISTFRSTTASSSTREGSQRPHKRRATSSLSRTRHVDSEADEGEEDEERDEEATPRKAAKTKVRGRPGDTDHEAADKTRKSLKGKERAQPNDTDIDIAPTNRATPRKAPKEKARAGPSRKVRADPEGMDVDVNTPPKAASRKAAKGNARAGQPKKGGAKATPGRKATLKPTPTKQRQKSPEPETSEEEMAPAKPPPLAGEFYYLPDDPPQTFFPRLLGRSGACAAGRDGGGACGTAALASPARPFGCRTGGPRRTARATRTARFEVVTQGPRRTPHR